MHDKKSTDSQLCTSLIGTRLEVFSCKDDRSMRLKAADLVLDLGIATEGLHLPVLGKGVAIALNHGRVHLRHADQRCKLIQGQSC